MLTLMTQILNELKYEIVNYFDNLVVKVLIIGTDVVADSYLRRKYVNVDDAKLSQYGRDIKRMYQLLVMLLDEFRSIRKSRISSGAPQGQP